MKKQILFLILIIGCILSSCIIEPIDNYGVAILYSKVKLKNNYEFTLKLKYRDANSFYFEKVYVMKHDYDFKIE
jgi:hypothetical protein